MKIPKNLINSTDSPTTELPGKFADFLKSPVARSSVKSASAQSSGGIRLNGSPLRDQSSGISTSLSKISSSAPLTQPRASANLSPAGMR